MATEADLRLRAQTDLYFLATKICDYDLVPEVHAPECNFFLKLNPEVPLYDLDTVKNRLLLDPRGHFKTTIDIVHIIQLIICYPNIRILIVSGTQELAMRMLGEVRNHFLYNQKLRDLFPEHAVTKETAGNAYDFTTPARSNWKLREPTVTISTIGSVKAGSHFDYIKYDDMVNEKNTETREMLDKTTLRFQACRPLLDVPMLGYQDVIGTRYDHSDTYGWIIDHNEGDWAIFHRAACSLPFNPSSTILFPRDAKGNPRFSYKILFKMWKENPRHFGCQYLNDPSFGDSSSFPEQLMRDAIVPKQSVPLVRRDPLSGETYKASRVFMHVDLAFSEKKAADFTVVIVGAYDAYGTLYLVDMLRGRFGADDFVQKFLSLLMKWGFLMGRVSIEEAAGGKLLGPALRMAARDLQIGLPIDWVAGSPKRIKHERIFGLLPVLKAGKLKIADDLPGLEDLIKEFVRFPRTKHDDIPDAVSELPKYATMVDLAPVASAQEMQAPWAKYLRPPEPEWGRAGYGLVG